MCITFEFYLLIFEYVKILIIFKIERVIVLSNVLDQFLDENNELIIELRSILRLN